MSSWIQINSPATAANIARLAGDAGLTVKQIHGKMPPMSIQTIYKWFQGVSLPSLDNLVILADILGVTIDEIIITEKHEEQ